MTYRFDINNIFCLADRDIPDREYRDIFLCTVNYFTTMEYVVKKLIERYESYFLLVILKNGLTLLGISRRRTKLFSMEANDTDQSSHCST